jgi:hypothetical protein
MTWRHRNALIKVREENAGARPDLSAIEPRRKNTPLKREPMWSKKMSRGMLPKM